MLAADHGDELPAADQFFRAIVERIHHPLGRIKRRRLVEGVNAELVNFSVSLVVIQLHVARSIDNRRRALPRATAIRHSTFVTDGPNQDARFVEAGKFFFGDTAEVHRQGLRFGHETSLAKTMA